MICGLRTIWYNIRYFHIFGANGLIADGHNLYYTGDMHDDYWVMKCVDCDEELHSEIGPDAKPIEIK